jgi:MFS family permease
LIQNKKVVLYLMSGAIVLGYLPWYNFSAVLPIMERDLGLTGFQVGNILGAFQAGYVLMVIITGWLADRIGARRVVLAGTLGVAACSTAFAFLASDFSSILILRTLTGMFAGAIYAPGMVLLSKWFPSRERGFAIGVYSGALVLAYAGSYFVAGPIAASSGWQAGILWTSLPSLLGAVLIIFVPEHPSESSLANVETREGLEERVLNTPSLLVTGAYMGHMWELYAFWGWVGPAMVAAATAAGSGGAEAARLGSQMASLVIIMGAPAPWIVGTLSDRIGRSTAACICLLASGLASLLFGWFIGGSLLPIIILGIWYGFWAVADTATYKAGLTDMVSTRIRGTSLGFQSALGFGITIISPQIFGAVLDTTNKGNPALTVWGPAFAVLAAGPIIGLILLAALRRHPKAILMAGGRK